MLIYGEGKKYNNDCDLDDHDFDFIPLISNVQNKFYLFCDTMRCAL